MRLMSSGKEPQRLLSMKLRGVKIELLLKYILITEYLAIGPFILYVLLLDYMLHCVWVWQNPERHTH